MIHAQEDDPDKPRWPLANHFRCPAGGYDLYGIVGEPFRCPECGNHFSLIELAESNNPRDPHARVAYVVAALAGFALWAVFSVRAGGDVIWESAASWMVGLPALLALNGVFGYFCPDRPWRWSIVLVAAQSLLIVVTGLARGHGLVLPAGVCFGLGLCLLSLPFAYAGAALRIMLHD